MFSIRYYKDSDYKDLKQTLQEGKLFDCVWESRKSLKRKIMRDPESIILATLKNNIVGCVFIVEDGWNGFVWRLSVKEKFRKKGVGSMLMRKAEEIIRTRGIKESSIFVDSKNDFLKAWYEKQGYLQTSDYTFMYRKLDSQK